MSFGTIVGFLIAALILGIAITSQKAHGAMCVEPGFIAGLSPNELPNLISVVLDISMPFDRSPLHP